MTEDSPQKDALQSLIAEILDAEARGDNVDREALVCKHPQHETSLLEFFANHDSMKAGQAADDVTLPPMTPVADEVTLPPGQDNSEDATLLPAVEHSSETDIKVGATVRYFGDYELLEEIARGGMGVVYKARQVNLNRIVALKMILAGQLAGEEDVKRFYTEAEAAANLDHPGIVPIFEIGEHQGQHYFSMGYIEGQSLAQKVADGPLPPREAAELVRKICEAMAYAHERGVIHRDLKPANILIDQNGQPRVTDFGLAKQMNVDSGLTGTGQILGTPSYMAPEQASGKVDVGPLADVYALGAILYCLLTGRPPFQAANPMDTLLQVLDKEPISPRQLNASVPVDLETICLKCLDKESLKRYNTAEELHEEVKRFLSGRPIMARQLTRAERVWRWCKRNPGMASLSFAAVIFLLAGSIGSSYFAVLASGKATLASMAEQRATRNAEESRSNEAIAIAERLRADEEAEHAKTQMKVALDEQLRAETMHYAGQIKTAMDAIAAKHSRSAWDTLGDTRVEFRGWEYLYVQNLLEAGRTKLRIPGVTSCDFDQTGERLFVGTDKGKLEVWDLRQKSLIKSVDVGESQVQNVLASGEFIRTFDSTGILETWHANTLELSHKTETSIEAKKPTRPFARFADNGNHFLTGVAIPVGGVLQLDLRDIKTGELTKNLYTASPPRVPNTMATASQSGNVAALARYKLKAGPDDEWSGQIIEIWSTNDGERLHEFKLKNDLASAIAFSPSGALFAASRGITRGVHLWDVKTGVHKELPVNIANIGSITFSPDETRLAVVSSDLTVHLVSADDGELLQSWTGHRLGIQHVLFDPSGKHLLAVDSDDTVFISDIQSLEHVGPVTLASKQNYAVGADLNDRANSNIGAISPKGSMVAIKETSNSEEWVELIPLLSGSSTIRLNGRAGVCRFSPDESLIAIEADEGAVHVYETATGKTKVIIETDFPIEKAYALGSLVFSQDGTRLAVGSDEGHIGTWAVESGTKLMDFQQQGGRIFALDFAFGDARLLCKAFAAGSSVVMWDSRTGREIWRSKATGANFGKLAVTSDGSKFVFNTVDYKDRENHDKTHLVVCEAKTGQRIGTIYANVRSITSFCFTDTGNRLLGICWSKDDDATVNLWDLYTGVEVASLITPYAHFDIAQDAVFTTNDSALITFGTIRDSSPDKSAWAIHRWGNPNSSEMKKFAGHTWDIQEIVFSADGQKLVSAGWDHTIRIWDVHSGKTLQILGARVRINDAKISPDGRKIAAATETGKIMIWILGQPYGPTIIDTKSDELRSIDFSPDGKLLVSGGRDGSVRLWDAETAKLIRAQEIHSKRIEIVDFSSDGTHVACLLGSSASIWGSKSGNIERQIPIKPSICMQYSPDGKVLAFGSARQPIALIDSATGETIRTLGDTTDTVNCIVFNSDERRLHAAYSHDDSIKTWDLSTGAILSTQQVGAIKNMAISADGKHLAVSKGNEIQLLELP